MSTEISSLVDAIAGAFPVEPLPPSDEITRCTYDQKNGGRHAGPCGDCVEISDYFATRRWNQPSADEYRRFCDAITLMTPVAFHYFLPGWLTVSLADPSAADVIPSYLMSVMSGRDTYSEQRIETCYDALNVTQLHCMQRFILWYRDHWDGGDEAVGLALERVQRRISAAQQTP